MMTPKRKHDFISVVIPCYNASRYIQDCLDGLAKQTYQQFEAIIVDDGSEDRSEETVKQWMKQRSPFFPIVYSKLPRNTGFAGALTVGYFLSAGEYIAVHDADDISHPERLEKQLSFLRQHPNIALVGTNYAAFPDGHFERQTPANWLAYGRDIRRVYAEGKHCICHGTIMFRGEVFDRLGGPTRRIHGAEDYEFIVKFLNAKLEIDNLPEILYYYRSHPKQRSRQFYQKGGG
ncbi:glycosyltransferase family 2 protein [Geobacillus subterraneus]|nr:glycosyltransferase family 2 protein [Geobacillus subterraneus]QIZ66972.1 glycosyltransferase family 2 protein [Geobacillus subterraneus]WPZ19201.1 glycosyltransferase family 2 protein [Geobacillus subterraneus]